MQTLALVVLGVMVLGVLARVVVGREFRFAEPVRLVSGLAAHIHLAVIFAWSRRADRGIVAAEARPALVLGGRVGWVIEEATAVG